LWKLCSMKIYFCGSIRGGRQDAELYARLIKKLQSFGPVLTEHVGKLVPDEKSLHLSEIEQDVAIFKRDMTWMTEADVFVAEVTIPSLGVGFELGFAYSLKKPILCLYRPQHGQSLSAMIQGAEDGTNFVVKHYEEAEADEIFRNFFQNLK